ncbi:MAG: hypothetical protein PF439_11045 [Helicobacteraceae bacterium]|jgi:uncharacterized membrane protein YukC|nr:hypothetical protein [Helicobacteraceae bacterium]
MNDREIYQQEKQAILYEYVEKLQELKEIASASNGDAKSEFDKQIKTVETKLEEAKAAVEAVGKASEEEIEAHKKAIDETFRAIYTHMSMS